MSYSKYRAQPTTIDGIRFASKAEGRRYCELVLLQKAGRISELKLQPRYQLNSEGGGKVATYVADFEYVDAFDGRVATEDVKGVITPTFRLKQKLFEAQYGRKIRLVQKPSRSSRVTIKPVEQ